LWSLPQSWRTQALAYAERELDDAPVFPVLHVIDPLKRDAEAKAARIDQPIQPRMTFPSLPSVAKGFAVRTPAIILSKILVSGDTVSEKNCDAG
jgi:hypothetical protein